MSWARNSKTFPSGWRTSPAWSIMSPIKRQGHESEEVLSVYRDYGVIPKSSREGNFNRTPDDLSHYQLVEPGDVVFNKMKAWSGSVGVSGHRGIVSPDYMVCKIRQRAVDSRYLHYLLRSHRLTSQYAKLSTGIRPSQWRLYFEDLRSIELPAPPLETQRRIADMLDAETARIDELIEKNERVVELVGIRRQSLITASVSGQSDVASPPLAADLAFSGPFQEPKLRWITQLYYGDALAAGNRRPGEVPVMGSNGRFDWHNTANVDGPCIIVGRKGSHGKVNWSDTAAWVTDTAFAIGPEHTSADIRWLFYALQALPLEATSQDTGVPGLSRSKAYELRVPTPPLEIQRLIADMLDEETSLMDEVVQRCKRMIELLETRRRSLVTAAVTGQVEV